MLMKAKYTWGENYKACRLQIDFGSLVKLCTIVGLCYGIMSIPLILFVSMVNSEGGSPGAGFSLLPFLLVASPIGGTLGGALMGVIGYPLYRWFSARTQGQTYTGIFVGLHGEPGHDVR